MNASANGTAVRIKTTERFCLCISRSISVAFLHGQLGIRADYVMSLVAGTEEGKTVQNLLLKILEVQINGRGDEQGNELGHDEAADDNQSQGTPRRAILTITESNRQSAQQRRHRGHDDGPEPLHAGFVNRVIILNSMADTLFVET